MPALRKPNPAASLAADLRHLPLVVTPGWVGYRLAYAAGDHFQSVNWASFAADPSPPIEFATDMHAKATGDYALTVTDELLARVLKPNLNS